MTDLILYTTDDGRSQIKLRADQQTVWLTQLEMAELFDTTKQNISLHLKNIFEDRELDEDSVVKDSLTTAADGKRYQTLLYNLDAILAVGYRVRSPRGVQFRRWASTVLKEYLIKGFVMDDERLKNPDGRVIDLDLRGSDAAVLARLPSPAPEETEEPATRGPGRPKLGVVAREVTLLPRHWEWLSSQPGGASVALRKLVEEARRQSSQSDRQRQSREAAYRFMSAMAGDEAGFEEASRALFAGREADFMVAQQSWPADIRSHAIRLAAVSFASSDDRG